MSPGITVLIPAYNEAESISDTVNSLLKQTVRPTVIIVIDDCSTDGTFEVAESAGATVVRPPKNTGSKAGAQNFALPLVETRWTMAIDADTILAPDAIEKLMVALDDEAVAAASGFVVPRYVRTVWERGRYVEYLFAFSFLKPVQDFFGKPLIASGCFSAYRTDALKALGGWSNRTMTEDIDLTWRFYFAGWQVRFVPNAVSYPIEPHDFKFMRKQLRRWSHGFVQNVRIHWRRVLAVPTLRMIVAVAAWDAIVASLALVVFLPLMIFLLSTPILMVAYVADLPVILAPILLGAVRRGETTRAIASIPSFLVLRAVNAFFLLEAIWSELIVNRPLRLYEKGH
ncbi:MAG: glycosyltransferase [Opitutales bacterium]|nr:glycosyltransferase [Opitutales bacterium]